MISPHCDLLGLKFFLLYFTSLDRRSLKLFAEVLEEPNAVALISTPEERFVLESCLSSCNASTCSWKGIPPWQKLCWTDVKQLSEDHLKNF